MDCFSQALCWIRDSLRFSPTIIRLSRSTLAKKTWFLEFAATLDRKDTILTQIQNQSISGNYRLSHAHTWAAAVATGVGHEWSPVQKYPEFPLKVECLHWTKPLLTLPERTVIYDWDIHVFIEMGITREDPGVWSQEPQWDPLYHRWHNKSTNNSVCSVAMRKNQTEQPLRLKIWEWSHRVRTKNCNSSSGSKTESVSIDSHVKMLNFTAEINMFKALYENSLGDFIKLLQSLAR